MGSRIFYPGESGIFYLPTGVVTLKIEYMCAGGASGLCHTISETFPYGDGTTPAPGGGGGGCIVNWGEVSGPPFWSYSVGRGGSVNGYTGNDGEDTYFLAGLVGSSSIKFLCKGGKKGSIAGNLGGEGGGVYYRVSGGLPLNLMADNNMSLGGIYFGGGDGGAYGEDGHASFSRGGKCVTDYHPVGPSAGGGGSYGIGGDVGPYATPTTGGGGPGGPWENGVDDIYNGFACRAGAGGIIVISWGDPVVPPPTEPDVIVGSLFNVNG